MRLELEGQPLAVDEQALRVSGRRAVVLGTAPTRLVVALGPGQRLVDVRLDVRRVESPGALAPTIAVSRDDPDHTRVRWLLADWGAPLSLRRLELRLASTSAHSLRLLVARGKSPWYPPPGPHTFDLTTSASAQTFTTQLPNTVAERLMLEFIGTGGNTPKPISLAAASGALTLAFDEHAREIALKLAERVVAAIDGLPAPGTTTPFEGVLESIRRTQGDALEGGTLEFELDAAVGGWVDLGWSFELERRIQLFGQTPTAELQLESGRALVELALLPESVLATQPRSLALQCTHQLRRDRELFGPSTLPNQARAELGRSKYDNAQAFVISDPRPLVGIDLWVRSLGDDPLALCVELHADRGGAPSGEPLAKVERELPAQPSPSWLEFEFSEPLTIPGSTWWVVVIVDAGELLWSLAERGEESRIGPTAYRRNGGEWLSRNDREPERWAVTRLRVLDEPPPPRLTLQVDDEPGLALPLGGEGKVDWSAPASPPSGRRFALSVELATRGHLTFSDLRLDLRQAP